MEAAELQLAFFKHIKEQLPAHLSFVEEVAGLLNISTDSAYRRIRAEKTIGFDELGILSNHFKVSLDQFFKLQTKGFLFYGSLVDREKFDIKNYLKSICNQLTYYASGQHKHIYYFNKDIPIFHHFMFPELAAFKCYFWSRYNMNYANFNRGQFLVRDFIDLFEENGKDISNLYLQIPSTELWNLNCINTTVMQICYYRDSKIFKSEEDINTVFDCLHRLVNHVEQQAEYGAKFPFERPDSEKKVKYTVFVNEFILGDNTGLIEVDDQRLVSLNHNVINYTITTDKRFTDYTWQNMQVLLKKSTLISEIGERDRQLFFDTLRQKIDDKRVLNK
jgi:hypothetical protein